MGLKPQPDDLTEKQGADPYRVRHPVVSQPLQPVFRTSGSEDIQAPGIIRP
jgi:hypothetical protein